MSAHISTVRNAITHALPYVLPTIADRIARQAAPMIVKEANHWAKRAGIDYRIVSSATKHRRKLARIREENMYYTPEELRYIQQKQAHRGPTPQQHMNLIGAGKEMYPPMVGPPTLHQAERATKFPGTVYRQFNGTPVTKEMYENMQRRATRARGRQYNANPCQVDPGPPPAAQDPNPRDATIGEEGYHIVEGSDPRQKPGAPAPYDPYEFVSDQYEFGLPEGVEPPPPLPPIGPTEPSPSPYLSLPAPPSDPLPKLLRDATIQPKSYSQKFKHSSKKKKPRKGYEHYTGYTQSEAKALANLMRTNTRYLSMRQRAQMGDEESKETVQELTPSVAEIPMMSSSLIRKKPRPT
jgi:hypothetical protein